MGAEGSQAGLNFVKESAWGVLPSSALQALNFTEETFSFNIENKSSNNVRPDRQTAELVQVGADASGGFTTEFQARNVDNILDGLLWGQWRETDLTAGAAGSNLDFSFVTETGADVGGIITFGNSVDISTLLAGDCVTFADMVNSENNGTFYIKAKPSAQSIQVDSALVTEVIEATATAKGSNLQNGVYRHSYSIERAHNDISQFFLYKGMVGDELSFTIEEGEPVIVSFTFVGKDETLAQTQWGTSDPTAAPTTSIINAVSSVTSTKINGEAISGCLLQKMDFTLKNKADGKKGVGVLGNCDVKGKSIDLTGNMTLYFEDATYYNKYLANTAFSIQLTMADTSGNTYIITLQKVKFSEVKTNVTGKDDDVLLESGFTAIVGDEGCTISISKILV